MPGPARPQPAPTMAPGTRAPQAASPPLRRGAGASRSALETAVIVATFESAPDGIVALDAAGQVLAFNAGFQALWNFPPDMLARRDVDEMRRHTARCLKSPQAFLRSIDALRATRDATVFDQVELLDGRIFERQVVPLNAPGIDGGLVVRWRDITQRVQAEAQLRQTQARFSAVFEHALNAILLADDSGRYLDANPAACALLGYTREELLGLGAAQVVLPGSLDVDRSWSEFLRDGSSHGRVQLLRKDGRSVEAQFSAVAQVLPGVHLSILSDLSAERRQLQQQQELRALLELAMAGSEQAYWEVDLQGGKATAANAQWHRSLGYQPGEVPRELGAWDALLHADDRAGRDEAWRAHVQGHSPSFEAEFRMRHKGGHWVWLLARGRAVARDAQGLATRVVGMRMDISARKQAELLLREQAQTDSLTGLANRRRFFELAATELARALRYRSPLSLLMLDMDHFKRINDEFGHGGGDTVLRQFAHTVLPLMRHSDVPGRLGGEEFAVLLPQTGAAGALEFAQRLLKQVRQHPVTVAEGVPPVAYTVSIGIATREAQEEPARDLDALMRAADVALYQAKSQGRDRAVAAGPG